MHPYKIEYTIKNTKSKNTYIQLNQRDENILLQTILSLNSYMQELCLSNDIDIVTVSDWWRKPNKKYPYNKRLNLRNTPETMIAGLINNMVFGKQENISLEQIQYLEEIINKSVSVIKQMEVCKNIQLQTNPAMTTLVFGLGI